MTCKELSFSDYLKFLFKYPQIFELSPWSNKRVKDDIYRWINKTKIISGSVLDIGCGFGIHASLFAKMGFSVTAMEQFPEFYFDSKYEWQKESQNLKFVFEKFPCKLKDEFDLIVVNNNYVLFDQVENVFEEIRTRLKAAGSLVIDLTSDRPIFPNKKVKDFSLFEDGLIVSDKTGDSVKMLEYKNVPYHKYLGEKSEIIEKEMVNSGFKINKVGKTYYCQLKST